MKVIKTICFFVVVGVCVNFFCVAIKSNYLVDFLNTNIILISIPLLAINTATSSFIIAKLSDITEKHGTIFTETYKELKVALYEQLFLIAFSILCLVIKNSIYFLVLGTNASFIVNSLLIGTFAYNLDICRDTGVAIFEIFETLEDLKKKDK